MLSISSMLATYSISEALHIASSTGVYNDWASKVVTADDGCKVFDGILPGADSIDEPPGGGHQQVHTQNVTFCHVCMRAETSQPKWVPLQSFSSLRLRQELVLDDLFDGLSWKEAFCPQGRLLRVHPHKHHCGQALDLHAARCGDRLHIQSL